MGDTSCHGAAILEDMATDTKTTGRESDKVMLRLPDGMRDRLKEAAALSNRTMNAEIVVRLAGTFPVSNAADSLSVEQLLKDIPLDLASQYGLFLYRTELQRANEQLEAEQANFTRLWATQQKSNGKAETPGAQQTRKEAMATSQQRIGELKNQAHLIEQTVSAIHFHRKAHGLAELRNVRELSVSVQVGGR